MAQNLQPASQPAVIFPFFNNSLEIKWSTGNWEKVFSSNIIDKTIDVSRTAILGECTDAVLVQMVEHINIQRALFFSGFIFRRNTVIGGWLVFRSNERKKPA